MSNVLKILSSNYSGKSVNITFTSISGDTLSFENVSLPYNFVNDTFDGNYTLFFPDYNLTHKFQIPAVSPVKKCRCAEFRCVSFLNQSCKISYTGCGGNNRSISMPANTSFRDCVTFDIPKLSKGAYYDLYGYCNTTSDCMTLTQPPTPTPTVTPTPTNTPDCRCYEFTNNTVGTTAVITANKCSGFGTSQLILTNPAKPTGKICVPGSNFTIQQQNPGDVTWVTEYKCGFRTNQDALNLQYTCPPECSLEVVKGPPPPVQPIGSNTEINIFISYVTELGSSLIPIALGMYSPGGSLYECLISTYNNSSLYYDRVKIFDYGYADIINKLDTEKNYLRESDDNVDNVINIVLEPGALMNIYYYGTLSNFITPTELLTQDTSHLREVLNSVNYSIGGFVIGLNTNELSPGGDTDYVLLMHFLNLLFTSTPNTPPPSLLPPVGLSDFYISNFTYVGSAPLAVGSEFWPQYLYSVITSGLNSLNINPNC